MGGAKAAADGKPVKCVHVTLPGLLCNGCFNCVCVVLSVCFLYSLHLCSSERGTIPWPSLHHREQRVLSLLCASQSHQGNIDVTFKVVKLRENIDASNTATCVTLLSYNLLLMFACAEVSNEKQ